MQDGYVERFDQKISPLPMPKRLRAGRPPLFALRARGPMGRRPKRGITISPFGKGGIRGIS
ncbi:MAG: hypothetical protein A2V86_17645 [Deltaproteobacteria bacterium RBG_16_49_23]|nr:MAG: hypothetical protein A2V86_17645 [Deltaproteobacteria bacterium RBG_16_49_23]